MSILPLNKNPTEQLIFLMLLLSSGSTNKNLPVPLENPFLSTMGWVNRSWGRNEIEVEM